MTNPTQFILNLSTVHRLLQHEGLIGIGKDFITDQASTIHTYSDKFKRSYVMQLYDNIETDFLSSKLNSIAKSAHSTFVSNMLRPLFMCTRKSSNKSYELAIFYDLTGLGYTTLETVIQSKRNS